MPRPYRFETRIVAAAACILAASCAQIPPAPAPETAPSPEAVPATPSGGASAQEQPARSTQRGRVSLYGKGLAGKPTASGDVFDPEQLTMAHRTLAFGTRVRVTNLENQRSVEVVVNDRGPFVPGRIADLSAAAARRIGMAADGVVEALLEIVRPVAAR